MGLSSEERDALKAQLLALLSDTQAEGFQELEPNRVDEHGRRDDDGQPLNEMNQTIASNRNRVAGAAVDQIQAALETLRDHPEEYGLCEECDQPIPLGRLKLVPYAPCCVACQSALEEPTRGIRRRRVTDHI